MPFRIKEFNDLLSGMDDWLKSALQDLTNYDVSHLNPQFSKEQGVEFIQRALENGVKISSFFLNYSFFLLNPSPCLLIQMFQMQKKSKKVSIKSSYKDLLHF